MENNFTIIHIGLLTAVFTFSIPIFWGLVKNIIVFLKEKGEDITKNFISSYFARKLSKKIVVKIFLPFIFFGFIGLFVITPFLQCSFSLKYMIWISYLNTISLFLFSVVSIKIFDMIYGDTQKETNNEISDFNKLEKEYEEKELLEFLESIFRETDQLLINKYGISPNNLIESIFDYINDNLEEYSSNEGSLIKKLEFYRKLIEIINSFLENREISNLAVRSDLLKKLLKLHFGLWHLYYGLLSKTDGKREVHRYLILFTSVNNIIIKLFSLSLDKDVAFIFLEDIESHTEEKKEESIDSYKYLDQFPFKNILFENYEKFSKHNAWDYLPREWLLDIENIKKNKPEDIRVIDFILKQYGSWLQGKIDTDNKWKNELDEVHIHWSPHISPKAWAYILTYKRRTWGNDSRIESLIKISPNFGWISRSFTHWGKISDEDIEQKMEEHENDQTLKTIELAQNINVFHFSKEEVLKILKEASAYNPENEKEKSTKKYVIYLFKKIFKYINS
ncbi:MAG: hypothetical protein ABH956_00130 [Candidatus Nealsonbacteria bacterium]